jgi:hypothetical protein
MNELGVPVGHASMGTERFYQPSKGKFLYQTKNLTKNH